jgi:uncharacterized protein (DUF58 family)
MKEVLKQVKKIELKTRKLVDTLMTGNYHSLFKGQGIEFSEIREYNLGDDIRSIDWNVTARMNSAHVKEFIEERDLRIIILFDISASGNFGNNFSKKQKAIELAATLMFSALRNSDKVGLFLFTDKIEVFIPCRKGKRHVLKLIQTLLTHKPSSIGTNLNNSLASVSKIIKKRSIIFVISDFFSEDFYSPLKILANKHDLIAVNINDFREMELPDVGLIELEDEETGEQILVDTSDITFRNNYKRVIKNKNDELQALFRKLKVDMIHLQTDQSYEISFRKFFNSRKVMR